MPPLIGAALQHRLGACGALNSLFIFVDRIQDSLPILAASSLEGMSQQNRQLKGPRHISAASLDTNASGIAESTISLGLSRFPSPPSSIPSTPQRSNFDTPSPSRSSFNAPSVAPLIKATKATKHEHPSPSSTTVISRANAAHSMSPSFLDAHIREQPHPSTSSLISSYDWHGGASVDVDATEDRLLPTSFITSLLQENKDLRKTNRTSYASTALTYISEMTYPPLMNHSVSGNMISAQYSPGRVPPPHRPQDLLSPPSSFPQNHNLSNTSNRISGDSETLHSTQGHPSMVRTASISRTPVPGTFVVGITPATLQNVSPSSQRTSTHDSDTLRMEKDNQRKLSTTYESGDDPLVNYKSFDPDYSPALPSTAEAQRRFLRDSSRLDRNTRNSMHSNKSAAPSFFPRISGISSIRRVFAWRKVKPLPPVPIIPNIPISVEDAHRKEEESTPLPDLVNRAGVLRDLLDRDQHPHYSPVSQPEFPGRSAPHDGYEHQPRNSAFLDYPRPASPRALPSIDQPIISTNLVPRKIKRLCVVISIFIIAALAAVGAGVGATVGKNKQGKFDCPANFTGTSCNLGKKFLIHPFLENNLMISVRCLLCVYFQHPM